MALASVSGTANLNKMKVGNRTWLLKQRYFSGCEARVVVKTGDYIEGS